VLVEASGGVDRAGERVVEVRVGPVREDACEFGAEVADDPGTSWMQPVSTAGAGAGAVEHDRPGRAVMTKSSLGWPGVGSVA
jgi:hypothetical protein